MKLATIERIHSIRPHPNADHLQIAKIKEWSVVIRKEEFRDGELVIFISIDSIVPATPYFEFLKDRKYRVWNAKFRGVPSQGLVCPISILPPDENPVVEGQDFTKTLGIVKFEKPIDPKLQGDSIGYFPTGLVPVTDEKHLLDNPGVLEELRGKTCYLTLKCDGSSCTVIWDNGRLRVCSRKLEQKEGTGFWSIVQETGLADGLKALRRNIAVQAEACGPKIQSNKMDLEKRTLFIFDARDIDSRSWFNRNELIELSRYLRVPLVPPPSFNLNKPDLLLFDDSWTIDRLQEIANEQVYPQRDGRTKPGEGIVLRPIIPCWSQVLERKLSVKIINVNY